MLGTPTRTINDVLTAAQRKFGDESGVVLTNADVIRWINQGQQRFVQELRITKQIGTLTSVAGNPILDLTPLSPAAYQIESIHYAGLKLRNIPYVNVEDQLDLSPSGLAQSGTPTAWYEWAGQVTLFPTPQSSDSVQVLYTAAPPVYTSSQALTTVLFIPDRLFEVLVNYVCQQAYEMSENFEASQAMAGQIQTDLANFSEFERGSADMVYPSVTLVDYY